MIDIQTEYAVLYCMINSSSALYESLSQLREHDFCSPLGRQVYNIIVELNKEGATIDETIIKNKVNSKKFVTQYNKFIKNVNVDENIFQEYIDALQKNSLIIQTKDVFNEGLSHLNKEGVDPLSVIKKSEHKLINMVIKKDVLDFHTLPESYDKILKDMKTPSNKDKVFTTGLKELDDILTINNGDLSIIAARPSVGKSAVALYMMVHNAFEKNLPSLFFSIEMRKENQWKRIISQLTKIDYYKVKGGIGWDDHDWKQFKKYSKLLKKNENIIINDLAGMDIVTLCALARREKIKNPKIMAVFVDYMQLMLTSLDGNREMTTISRALKILARDLDIPVIALSQLSRKCEMREDKRPMLSDLRESGAIEQDADSVMLLYRPFYYTKAQEDERKCEIILAKQREGETGTIHTTFNKRNMTFGDISK